MKECYYFPHDYNAHRDPKCAALIKDFGLSGYGLYWMMVEILHQEGGKIKKFPKLFDGLAFQLNVEKEYIVKLIEALLRDYELLQQDQNCIWSARVLRNIEDRKIKYQLKSQAGRIGGLMSGKKRSVKQNEAVLEANEQKKRKEKERKGNSNVCVFDFESLWTRYPRPMGKAKALGYFNASVKTEKDFKDINTALDNYLHSEVIMRDGGKYIQHGKTWFNNWRDYLNVQAVTGKSKALLELEAMTDVK